MLGLHPGLKDVRRPAELMHAYIVLSLLAGLRTGEARALRWQQSTTTAILIPIRPYRLMSPCGGRSALDETQTEQSRRTLALPKMAVEALRALQGSQGRERALAGGWQDTGLVFTSHGGAALDAVNIRKMFKRVRVAAGIGDGWTPRELRTSFVSVMSHCGVSIEDIARLAGHASTRTTEVVYRRELWPVITTGAEIMDRVFGAGTVLQTALTCSLTCQYVADR